MNTDTIWAQREEMNLPDKLSTAEVREAQRAAGAATAGPRRKPKRGDRKTDEGYRQPGRYKGTRNAERNQKIVEQLDRGDTPKQVAARYDLSEETVVQIRRYYVDPEVVD